MGSTLRIIRGEMLRHLKRAELHIAEGAEHIRQQRGIIDELDHQGYDSANARSQLRIFLEIQAMHEADMDRIRADLADQSLEST